MQTQIKAIEQIFQKIRTNRNINWQEIESTAEKRTQERKLQYVASTSQQEERTAKSGPEKD